MASAFWIALGVVASIAVIAEMVVRIVRTTRGGGSMKAQVSDLEQRLDDLDADLARARQRIEVLEKIVTDQKYDLGRQIDGLA